MKIDDNITASEKSFAKTIDNSFMVFAKDIFMLTPVSFHDKWKPALNELEVLYKRMVIMCFALMILWVLFYDGMGMLLNKDLLISSATKVEGISSFVVVIISIFIFLHFSNNYVFHSRAINKIAATTLGIYLLHDNNYIRPKLWEEWFANKEYFCSKALILHMGIKCLAIFVICALIEYIRAKYIEKWIKRLIDKNWNKYVLKVKDKKEKIITKLNIES